MSGRRRSVQELESEVRVTMSEMRSSFAGWSEAADRHQAAAEALFAALEELANE